MSYQAYFIGGPMDLTKKKVENYENHSIYCYTERYAPATMKWMEHMSYYTGSETTIDVVKHLYDILHQSGDLIIYKYRGVIE